MSRGPVQVHVVTQRRQVGGGGHVDGGLHHAGEHHLQVVGPGPYGWCAGPSRIPSVFMSLTTTPSTAPARAATSLEVCTLSSATIGTFKPAAFMRCRSRRRAFQVLGGQGLLHQLQVVLRQPGQQALGLLARPSPHWRPAAASHPWPCGSPPPWPRPGRPPSLILRIGYPQAFARSAISAGSAMAMVKEVSGSFEGFSPSSRYRGCPSRLPPQVVERNVHGGPARLGARRQAPQDFLEVEGIVPQIRNGLEVVQDHFLGLAVVDHGRGLADAPPPAGPARCTGGGRCRGRCGRGCSARG